ncbi:MAG: oxidoreductase, partial [Microbacteriaceae bacterium]
MTSLTARLDRLLGRVTMYRLVLVWLGLIGVVALGLTLVGDLAFGPLDLLASAAVALTVSYVVNRILARAFGVRPHSESTLITAALLVMIFQPTLDLAGLGALAVASLVAVASKYLIAVRGRHILNPAAFGALFIGLIGLDFSVWWVATPTLLPLVLIAAFTILFRTRRLPLGAVFLVVAAGLIIVRGVVSGQDPVSALTGAFTSYPILFFAGFMLSEPLTLPPRRWQ